MRAKIFAVLLDLYRWLLAWRDALENLPDAAWLAKAHYDGAIDDAPRAPRHPPQDD